MQILNQPVFKFIHPSMNAHEAPFAGARPMILHHVGLDDIQNLLLHIRLHDLQHRRGAGKRHRELAELREPRVERRRRGPRCGLARIGGCVFMLCLHRIEVQMLVVGMVETDGDSAAAGVTGDDDVLDAKLGNRIGDYGDSVGIVDLDLAAGCRVVSMRANSRLCRTVRTLRCCGE